MAAYSLKHELYRLCCEYIDQRVREVQNAITGLQDAASNETKSSAGDKYETGREMIQQEVNRETARLYELQKQKAVLQLISPDTRDRQVSAGSIVHTSSGNYYIAISAGQLKVDERVYIAISSGSPMGIKLTGLRPGDTFTFNGKQYRVEDIQ